MSVEFKDYPLSALEDGLTVRHPTQGYPVWLPAVGLRLAFSHDESVEHLNRQLAEGLRPFWEWFAAEFCWRTGRKAGRWLKTDACDARSEIASAPSGEWGQTFAGGAEKLQAHPVKCRISSWLDRGAKPVGALALSVPIPWFTANEGAFLQWIDELCDRLPVQAGHVGLCGVGAREFPSKWNVCEFFVLQHYLGVDPCDEAQMGPATAPHDGYVHCPQWLTLLGAQACERLGGATAVESAAGTAGLSTQVRRTVLKLQSSRSLDCGFNRPPAGFVAMNELLRADRGEGFFIGHAFETFRIAAFGETQESASALWAKRFDPETGTNVRWPGRPLATHSIDVGSPVSSDVPVRCDSTT